MEHAQLEGRSFLKVFRRSLQIRNGLHRLDARRRSRQDNPRSRAVAWNHRRDTAVGRSRNQVPGILGEEEAHHHRQLLRVAGRDRRCERSGSYNRMRICLEESDDKFVSVGVVEAVGLRMAMALFPSNYPKAVAVIVAVAVVGAVAFRYLMALEFRFVVVANVAVEARRQALHSGTCSGVLDCCSSRLRQRDHAHCRSPLPSPPFPRKKKNLTAFFFLPPCRLCWWTSWLG